MGDILTDLFNDPGFCDTSALEGPSSPENLFSILETLDCVPCSPEVSMPPFPVPLPSAKSDDRNSVTNRKPMLSGCRRRAEQVVCEADAEAKRNGSKRLKAAGQNAVKEEVMADGQPRVSHITVERNRRKQMNEHLSVLRSLMPCFYVKRGDQASIIGGVVEFIKELQTVLQSLEAKKQRKAYSDVLSPRSVSSPRPMSSPRPTPLSPRMSLPISPRTPQPASPYKPKLHLQHQHQQQQQQQAQSLSFVMTPSLNSPREVHHYDNGVKELAANSKSPVADVEVKFSGPNVLLKTVSHRIPGQALRIMTALECLSLEILHVSISTVDDTMLNTFTIKVKILSLSLSP
ncbi:Transcription factor SPEECHLESS [Nymphaea thermarum]|nr:Transcription factor SPEECHLESS [Nymphaea thermarum]